MINSSTKTLELADVTYVKRVSIGNINPNSPLNEEQQERQMALLNKCLNEYPKGKIIGKDISVGVFQVGDHQITLQRTTYHIGFLRKPVWLENNS